MKKTMKRFFALLLVLVMALSLLPMTALAEEGFEPIQEGDFEMDQEDFEVAEEEEFEIIEEEENEDAQEETNDADTAGAFSVGGTSYADLNEALSAAAIGTDKTVVVTADTTLSGSYIIPAGVTLLIPFDDANTLYTTSPDVVDKVANQIAYRTLTLDSNTSITVRGAISVGGKLFTSTNSHVCKPTGAYGQIQMNVGSQITVENGGELYAWGYITGSGNVHITSGATVYECFQVTDWRGGSATMKFGTPADVKKVFPFSQYYVQNIEAPLTIEYGGAEKAYIAAYG